MVLIFKKLVMIKKTKKQTKNNLLQLDNNLVPERKKQSLNLGYSSVEIQDWVAPWKSSTKLMNEIHAACCLS